ncbi:hypothetical protein MKW98_010653 [Papaver atlanticum]|uniref:Uncharacterized protein n=1 Tax=Papaver atlanticum TaxID=357466 RepID=A0AAD4SIA4_9MAGN|nr:hypothetical protein MKW98_010653 [Papaver atlanticum]
MVEQCGWSPWPESVRNRIDLAYEYGRSCLKERSTLVAVILKLKSTDVFNAATYWIADAEHPEGSGVGFKEEDSLNFSVSFYSKTKVMVEELLKEYDNVCTLRVRMPISSDVSNPCNFTLEENATKSLLLEATTSESKNELPELL